MPRHLITSALPYINGVKHLGNLVGSMLPAPDTFYAPADGWYFHWDAERTARVAVAFTSSQLPLPRPPGQSRRSSCR